MLGQLWKTLLLTEATAAVEIGVRASEAAVGCNTFEEGGIVRERQCIDHPPRVRVCIRSFVLHCRAGPNPASSTHNLRWSGIESCRLQRSQSTPSSAVLQGQDLAPWRYKARRARDHPEPCAIGCPSADPGRPSRARLRSARSNSSAIFAKIPPPKAPYKSFSTSKIKRSDDDTNRDDETDRYCRAQAHRCDVFDTVRQRRSGTRRPNQRLLSGTRRPIRR